MDGTPADCVKLGLAECFKTPPDWVIAGINPGSNIGIDINYSGTVGAAREGALNGISGLAASIRLDRVMDYDNLARYVMNMVEAIGEKGLPSGTFLNVNAPGIAFSQIQGIRITRQALNNLSSRFEKGRIPNSATITGMALRSRYPENRIPMSMLFRRIAFPLHRFSVISRITKPWLKCPDFPLTEVIISRSP